MYDCVNRHWRFRGMSCLYLHGDSQLIIGCKDHGQSEAWKEREVQLVPSQQEMWKGKVANQNNEEPFSGFHPLGNSCHSLVQNLLSFCLLPKSTKIKTHKNLILLVLLCGCETWFLTVRKVHWLMVSENRMLKRKCGPKIEEIRESCIMRKFMICTHY